MLAGQSEAFVESEEAEFVQAALPSINEYENARMKDAQNYTESFFADALPGALASARVIVPMLLELMVSNKPQSAVDFGCGLGAWLKALQENGVSSVLGVDGNYVDRRRLQISESVFKVADLERDPPRVEPFDLALCIEVAEHLPEGAARLLVERVAEAAPVVLFSAAVPGQGGTHHVNEKWPSYWAKHFAELGFRMTDPIRPQILGDRRVEWWYRQNLVVFVRTEALGKYPRLADYAAPTSPLGLEWIHVNVVMNPDPEIVLKRVPRATLQLLWRRMPLSPRLRSRIRRLVGEILAGDL